MCKRSTYIAVAVFAYECWNLLGCSVSSDRVIFGSIFFFGAVSLFCFQLLSISFRFVLCAFGRGSRREFFAVAAFCFHTMCASVCVCVSLFDLMSSHHTTVCYVKSINNARNIRQNWSETFTNGKNCQRSRLLENMSSSYWLLGNSRDTLYQVDNRFFSSNILSLKSTHIRCWSTLAIPRKPPRKWKPCCSRANEIGTWVQDIHTHTQYWMWELWRLFERDEWRWATFNVSNLHRHPANICMDY